MHPLSERLDRWTRLALAMTALGLTVSLGVARLLEPNPEGHGTHQQLGLAPCLFRQLTGVNCPSCGMTTALAWITRGGLGRSWSANPGGFVLAAGSLVAIPWLAVTAWLGRPWGTRSWDRPLAAATLGALVWTLLAWFFRLVFEWRVLG